MSRGGKSTFFHVEYFFMLNLCYRGCCKLFPGSKILKNDLLTAEKINFEVGSKIFLKKIGSKNFRFFSMKNQ